MTEYVTPEDVDELCSEVGFHVRERSLLLSALAAPLPVFGEEVYPEPHQKAAVLISAINQNHPLFDGNKRLSWFVAVAFYELNGMDLSASAREIDDFIRGVAGGAVSTQEIEAWLQRHTAELGSCVASRNAALPG